MFTYRETDLPTAKEARDLFMSEALPSGMTGLQ